MYCYYIDYWLKFDFQNQKQIFLLVLDDIGYLTVDVLFQYFYIYITFATI